MAADTSICVYLRLNVAFLNNRSTDGSGRPFCSLALEAEMNSNKCVLDASSKLSET